MSDLKMRGIGIVVRLQGPPSGTETAGLPCSRSDDDVSLRPFRKTSSARDSLLLAHLLGGQEAGYRATAFGLPPSHQA